MTAATRDLSGFAIAGDPFTVIITTEVPQGATVVGVEDTPPVGWAVSNISDAGTWDVQNGKVKWGLFFDPSIPTTVTYDVSATRNAMGLLCFAGTVSVEGVDFSIEGEQCLAIGVPTLTGWGMFIMLLAVLTAATLVITGRPASLGARRASG